MGSVDMAFNKILSVLLVAGSAWTNPQNNFFNFNNFATQRPVAPSPTVSTTPVPILRYVDTQNIDGSYTYGYEAADGTYKLETRYTDGRVKGKYGYIDPDGNLREASYGAEAGRGFEPQIEGLELPPPVTTPEEAFNEIPEQVPQKQFQNFQPTENTNDNKVSTPIADSNNPGPLAVFLQDRRVSDQYNQLQLLQLVELVILLSATLI